VNGATGSRFGRLGRLILKEQKEILRDRRTLLTLVVMPLVLYPLVGLVIQQFMLASGPIKSPQYRIGFRNEEDARIVGDLLQLAELGRPKTAIPANQPDVSYDVQAPEELARRLEAGMLDVLIHPKGRLQLDPGQSIAVDLEFVTLIGNRLSEEASQYLRARLDTVSKQILAKRLMDLKVPQRPEPIRIELRPLPPKEKKSGFPLASVAPFMLILMTITGAVYPAIDLTAGERERGTLEMLMAAPVPRLSILFAKYLAVLTVALLTALVNVAAMAATLYLTDVGRMIVGEGGLSAKTIVQGLAALVLFVGFFSALLLALSSFARSFKEAQAYLIPLMLVALAPGVISLFPGVELTAATAAAPLLNIVLYARDLLRGSVDWRLTAIVLASNACYAAAALGLAARLFGSEGVLYGGSGSWSGLFRRPSTPKFQVPPATAVFVLGLAIPAFLLLSGLGRIIFPNNIVAQTLCGAVVLVLVFVVVPWTTAWGRHVDTRHAFAASPAGIAALFAGLLLGASLWPFALAFHSQGRSAELLAQNPELASRLTMLIDELRRIPISARIVLLAVIPAACEEWFFRGFLFGALRRYGAVNAVVSTTVLFAAFHLISPSGLTPDRFTPSLFLGAFLGFLRWRSESVWPGMLLHAVHNSVVATALEFPKVLGVVESSQGGFTIPVQVYGMAGGAIALAMILLALSPRSKQEA
jgi:sodium transport system permease protein